MQLTSAGKRALTLTDCLAAMESLHDDADPEGLRHSSFCSSKLHDAGTDWEWRDCDAIWFIEQLREQLRG